MENRENGDSKNKADREKFEQIEKVELAPLKVKGHPPSRTYVGRFKSPDERNPKWVPDPEDVRKDRKAAVREAKNLAKKNEPD